ncbi:MAG: hypothetical protein LBG71_05450 [Clostridiales Family XIII bacterium]|jgi:hypothetical protein|nr:hypothetical protein [Clostridiales Family XIII bacterium]
MDRSYASVKGNSRSALFLTELILAILIFTLSMGICGSVFARAFEAASGSERLNQAVNRAQNAAEEFHARDDAAALAGSLQGSLSASDEITVYFDKNWDVAREPLGVAFVLKMRISGDGVLKTAHIVVSGRKEIYQLTATKNTALRRA